MLTTCYLLGERTLAVDLAHYFVTASVAEAAMLDAGGVPGWIRTGADLGFMNA
jgi:hypothetical protein